MSRMAVNQEECTLCGTCEEACPFGAIEITESSVVFTEDCRYCQACIEACPQEAISMETAEQPAVIDLSAYKGVLVYVEQREGAVHPVSYEMMGKGLELARALGQPLTCVMAGYGMEEQAAGLLWYGADAVYLYDHPELRHFRAEPYTSVVCDAVEEMRPNILLVGATHLGRSLAPRVATRLRTGLTADCTSLDVRPNGDLVQTRPAFGGNVMARILTPAHRPQMATVRYKVMEKAQRVDNPHGQVIRRQLPSDILASGIEVLEVLQRAQTASITEADIVVSAGRGAGNARGLALVDRLAQALGGVTGGSRPLVEQGLIPHAQQVGLSGRTVRPKLYIACGISGAVQHLAGMRGSDVIIAINKDSSAPIFDVAHVAVVGDLYDILPQLIELVAATNRLVAQPGA